MQRLQNIKKLFKKNGIRHLLLEIFVVFIGVYLAFVFQNYSTNKRIKSERQKVLIGLKEDLEYFRFFFPGYAVNAEKLIRNWNEVHANGSYVNYSNWRFIQPQYDYTTIEYALNADAGIIGFELNSDIAEVYQELLKLRYTEEQITDLAMRYTPSPNEVDTKAESSFLNRQNRHHFRLFIDRSSDRAIIMRRIAKLSNTLLPQINQYFTVDELKSIELSIITRQIETTDPEKIEPFLPSLLSAFPLLSEEEIRTAFKQKSSISLESF